MKKFLSLFFTSIILFGIYGTCEAKDLRFVQISDVRYSAGNDNQTFANVIQDVNKQKNVEFVVFTGDNLNKPSVDDLDGFIKEAKKLNCPYYVVIGDKDVNKLKHLSKIEYAKYLKKHIRKYKPETPSYTFIKNDIVFIVVDGAKDVIPGTNGYFKEDVLTWLDSELTKNKDKNVIILQHFPIIPPAEKESYYTFKPEEYMKVLIKHNNVKAVISGHFGVNNEQSVRGVSHISTSGIPDYRIIDIMDADTSNPTIWAQLKQAE